MQTRRGKADWICQRCGESVPSTFDTCWNCSIDPQEEIAGQGSDEPSQLTEAVTTSTRKKDTFCAYCGSNKVIANVQVCDQGQHSNGNLRVVVCGDPNAIFFKDRLYGDIVATICADCGRVELRVENAAELYSHSSRPTEEY